MQKRPVTAKHSSAWAFQTRQWRGLKPPIDELAQLAQLIELRMDLGAYRDDAHLAAWREPYDISPHAWEVMTRIWQGQTGTLETLSNLVASRGFSPTETAVALEDLIKLGWLVQADENYQLTEEGISVRQTAEQQTNHIFFTPWSVLNSGELESIKQTIEAISSNADHKLRELQVKQ